MGIEDIQISEELETNAPSIKYRGNEGPKSPQEMAQFEMKEYMEEFESVFPEMKNKRGTPEYEIDLKEYFEGLAKGPILPSDEDPINPFAPKPIGPVLPNKMMAGTDTPEIEIEMLQELLETFREKFNRDPVSIDELKRAIGQMREKAAYGGIMGLDGRKQYGIGSWFQEKIMDPIKNNKAVAATAAALAGYDLFGREDPDASILRQGGNYVKNLLYGKQVDAGDDEIVGTEDDIITGTGILNKKRGGTQDKDDGTYTYGGKILETIGKNIVPAAGGIMAGLFTKNQQGGGQDASTYGQVNDQTAMNIQNLTKTANLLDQKQGLAASMNFLPAVAARKYTPEEMAITYANAANGGRIGYENGGDPLSEFEVYRLGQMGYDVASKGVEPFGGLNVLRDILKVNSFAMGGRINRAEGGIMDLGGMEKDYRAEGGFVPIGKQEKADDVPARLSVNEFVFTADAVRNAGGGDIDQGAQVMENMMKHLEQGGQVSEESQGMQGARDMFATSQRLGEVI